MITVACWLWRQPGYRSTFEPSHVAVLRRMVARHYSAPHRFCVVTNEPGPFDSGIEVIPDKEDFATVKSPHGGSSPSCYRRLAIFGPDAAARFGERIVSLDLDCVITGDLRPLWDRPDDFVAWRDPMHARQINASMMLLRAGSRPQVWDDFRPLSSPRQALQAGCKGSDQGWISYCLPDAATWTTRPDGVYSYRIDQLARGDLPNNARVVMFHGREDPWSSGPQGVPWVRQHWQ